MMTPEQASERGELYARLRELIVRLSQGARDDRARDELLLELACYQARWVAPYGRFFAQRTKAHAPSRIAEVPALPTDAFRVARISSRSEADDVRTFESSGTTQTERSKHSFADLTLYDAAAEAAARHALFPDVARIKLMVLAPHESEQQTSSLSYMLTRFARWFGSGDSLFVWPLQGTQLSTLHEALREAERTNTPVALLGTSFAFVHALEGLGEARYVLPEKSRIMQTGGFKGRSREVAPHDMRAWLSNSFGVEDPWIIAEYGMTELSSQLYETTLRDAALGRPVGPRRLWAPPWVRAALVDPESQRELEKACPGVVRIDDAANLDSVAAIQTADVGQREGDGFVLLGRAQGAIARGCSITADELLGSKR